MGHIFSLPKNLPSPGRSQAARSISSTGATGQGAFLRRSFPFVFGSDFPSGEPSKNSYSRTRRAALRDCTGSFWSGYELDEIKCTTNLYEKVLKRHRRAPLEKRDRPAADTANHDVLAVE